MLEKEKSKFIEQKPRHSAAAAHVVKHELKGRDLVIFAYENFSLENFSN